MTRAVFLDALGTLVELEPPWLLLRERVPPAVSDEQLVAAVRKEMAYYKAHAHEGRDADSLADLRDRCAGVLSRELGIDVPTQALVDSVRMTAYPDAEPALRALRERGLKTIVVSNWDCSLGEVLERTGLSPWLDGAISSAEAGHRKPDPGIFAPGLELAECEPGEALHVGDTPEEDGEGARAAGIRVLLIDRDRPGTGDGEISSLTEIVQHLDG
ncbi:MAG TPA: HAD-IA family hydrolase [Solirubrobacterales bacterium]|jgi:putative hydrolase of the HAD superfamily|nr:HAD-IA family hydrolase [Solirubrobacterales bacterium]